MRLEALAEGFNLTNRANVVTRNTNFGAGAYPTNPAPTYGQITAVGDPQGLSVRSAREVLMMKMRMPAFERSCVLRHRRARGATLERRRVADATATVSSRWQDAPTPLHRSPRTAPFVAVAWGATTEAGVTDIYSAASRDGGANVRRAGPRERRRRSCQPVRRAAATRRAGGAAPARRSVDRASMWKAEGGTRPGCGALDDDGGETYSRR